MARSLVMVAAGVTLVLAACGATGDDGAGSATSAAARGGAAPGICDAPFDGAITVAAASSLTEAFTDIGESFEDACGGTVTFTFDSSGTLSLQIIDGAPVDVFASADATALDRLATEGLTEGGGDVFARNQLAIVTRTGNPEGIETLADLADVGIVSLCGQEVPCGRFAGRALADAGVSIDERSVTRGQNAKATINAVTEGDAVAAIVYVTDAIAAGEAAEAVAIPDDQNVIATYPIAVLADTSEPDLAEAFVSYVSSEEGLAVMAERGFLGPT